MAKSCVSDRHPYGTGQWPGGKAVERGRVIDSGRPRAFNPSNITALSSTKYGSQSLFTRLDLNVIFWATSASGLSGLLEAILGRLD